MFQAQRKQNECLVEAVVHLESKARVSEIKLSGFGTSDNKPKKRQTTGVTGFYKMTTK